MKKALIILTAAALVLLSSCRPWHEEVYFDTPFVSIVAEGGQNSEMVVDKEANNLLTALTVTLCASNTYFTEPVTVDYEVICGNGLKQGVDFEIQSSTKSPLTFDLGTYKKTIRILWYRNSSFDPNADNTLTIKLCGSSIPQMVFGYPGPDALHSSFIFTKQ